MGVLIPNQLTVMARQRRKWIIDGAVFRQLQPSRPAMGRVDRLADRGCWARNRAPGMGLSACRLWVTERDRLLSCEFRGFCQGEGEIWLVSAPARCLVHQTSENVPGLASRESARRWSRTRLDIDAISVTVEYFDGADEGAREETSRGAMIVSAHDRRVSDSWVGSQSDRFTRDFRGGE
jgi:hypothetical protein